MSLTDAGLAVFVVVVVLDAFGLLLDLAILLEYGLEATITRRVRRRPVLGLPIVAAQIAAAAGIVVHLYG
jgi:hypothetical protein